MPIDQHAVFVHVSLKCSNWGAIYGPLETMTAVVPRDRQRTDACRAQHCCVDEPTLERLLGQPSLMGLLLWLPFLRTCQVGSRHHIDGHAAIDEGPAGQAVMSEVGAALRQVQIDVVRSGLAERLPYEPAPALCPE